MTYAIGGLVMLLAILVVATAFLKADAVKLARTLLPSGEGADECDECGEPIPAKRRAAIPGVRTCVACQAQRDAAVRHSAINRRGSKDSQLR